MQSTKRQKHDNDNHPKDPKLKHDLFATANIINSLRGNAGTCIFNNATELFHIVHQDNKIALDVIAAVYSYEDAPTLPRPPSGHLVLSALIPQKLCSKIFHGIVSHYTLAVKHPRDICGDKGRMQQATDFNLLLEFLRDNNLAACLQPEQGRWGCLVPMSGYRYAASVTYLPSEVVNDRIEFLKKEEIRDMEEQQRMQEYLEAVEDDNARIEAARVKMEILKKALRAGRLKVTPVHGRFDGRGYLTSSSVSMQRSEANSCPYVNNNVQEDDPEEGEIIDSQLASSTSNDRSTSVITPSTSQFGSTSVINPSTSELVASSSSELVASSSTELVALSSSPHITSHDMNCCNGTNCHHETSSGVSTGSESGLKINPTTPMHPHLMRNRSKLPPKDRKRLDKLLATVVDNPPFVPRLRGDPDNRWEQDFEITRDELDKGIARSTARIQKILEKNPKFSILGNYWIAIIKVAVPGSKLYFTLLHCALEWFRSHATINCGGNQAFGPAKDLKKSPIRTLSNLSHFNKYIVDNCEPTLEMGYTADAVGGINGNQFLCPTCSTDGFTRCPVIDPVVNETDVTVAIMTIGLNHCSEFNIFVWLNSFAGMGTGVNGNILDKLVDCNSESVTICSVGSAHFQYAAIPFEPIASDINDAATYERTSKRISGQMRAQSDSLARHLAKCGVYPERSLLDSLSDNPDLLMIQSKPTREMFEGMVIKHADREAQLKRQIMGYILSNVTERGHKLVTSEIEDVPDYIIKYLINRFSEIFDKFSQVNTPGDVTLRMLHGVMISRANDAKRRKRLETYPSIEAAFNNEGSIDGLVDAVQRVQEIAELRPIIAGMQFNGYKYTFTLGCANYKNRRSVQVQENPDGRQLKVRIQWMNEEDDNRDNQDKLQKAMRAILDAGEKHDEFWGLPWWKVQVMLLAVFGIKPELKLLLRKAIEGESGIDDIVGAIWGMQEIAELRSSIADMKYGGNPNKCTFALGCKVYRDRPSEQENPTKDSLLVTIQWRNKGDSKNKDSIQAAMGDILRFWQKHGEFKNLPWCEIIAKLKAIFSNTN